MSERMIPYLARVIAELERAEADAEMSAEEDDLAYHNGEIDALSFVRDLLTGQAPLVVPDDPDTCENCHGLIHGGNPFSRFCDSCEPMNFDAREVN